MNFYKDINAPKVPPPPIIKIAQGSITLKIIKPGMFFIVPRSEKWIRRGVVFAMVWRRETFMNSKMD